MRIALVGGAGYIGAHIALRLRDLGHDVAIYDDLSTGIRENVAGFPLTVGDVRDTPALTAFLRGCDAVVHLAALKSVGDSMRDARPYASVNVAGTASLLTAMVDAGVPRLVFSSSAAVYGTPERVPIGEDHPLRPLSWYGETKRIAEDMMQWYAHIHGLHVVSLRYFNAAGYDPRISGVERNPQNLLPLLCEALLGLRERVSAFGSDYPTSDGTCVRDYIHVMDLADAHVRALELNGGEPFIALNLGTGQGASVRECIASVQRHGTFAVTDAPRRPGDPPSLVADARLAREMLEWQPIHELDAIVDSMVAAYRRRENLKGS